MSNYNCRTCNKEINEFEYDCQNARCYSCWRNACNDDLAQLLRENEETETDFEDEDEE